MLGNMKSIFTIGHSTHSIEHFIELLARLDISAIADVRSTPASRFAPQFNREALRRALASARVRYVFLGKELGARSPDPHCYIDGKVQYGRLAETPEFVSGIDRLVDGASREKIAIMCTEKEPLECHRTVLVSRVLADRGLRVSHIRGDGSIELHEDTMVRLREMHHLNHPSLLDTEEELLTKALDLQEAEIAYVDTEMASRA